MLHAKSTSVDLLVETGGTPKGPLPLTRENQIHYEYDLRSRSGTNDRGGNHTVRMLLAAFALRLSKTQQSVWVPSAPGSTVDSGWKEDRAAYG